MNKIFSIFSALLAILTAACAASSTESQVQDVKQAPATPLFEVLAEHSLNIDNSQLALLTQAPEPIGAFSVEYPADSGQTLEVESITGTVRDESTLVPASSEDTSSQGALALLVYLDLEIAVRANTLGFGADEVEQVALVADFDLGQCPGAENIAIVFPFGQMPEGTYRVSMPLHDPFGRRNIFQFQCGRSLTLTKVRSLQLLNVYEQHQNSSCFANGACAINISTPVEGSQN